MVTHPPFTSVDGVPAVYLAGSVLDDGALIGFVTLFGISLPNGIIMISHWRRLVREEGVPWGPGLIARGAKGRLSSVLMMALTTGLRLLPVTLGGSGASREVEGLTAQVILGGLITSCSLNLLVLPSLYRRLGNLQWPR